MNNKIVILIMDKKIVVEIKESAIGEKGLFVLKNFSINEIIFQLEGKELDKPSRESIHIGNNIHIHDEYGAFINHSFDPSVKIDGKNIIAIKEIKIGDEITFNYNDSEINMASPFMVNGIKVQGKQN